MTSSPLISASGKILRTAATETGTPSHQKIMRVVIRTLSGVQPELFRARSSRTMSIERRPKRQRLSNWPSQSIIASSCSRQGAMRKQSRSRASWPSAFRSDPIFSSPVGSVQSAHGTRRSTMGGFKSKKPLDRIKVVTTPFSCPYKPSPRSETTLEVMALQRRAIFTAVLASAACMVQANVDNSKGVIHQ